MFGMLEAGATLRPKGVPATTRHDGRVCRPTVKVVSQRHGAVPATRDRRLRDPLRRHHTGRLQPACQRPRTPPTRRLQTACLPYATGRPSRPRRAVLARPQQPAWADANALTPHTSRTGLADHPPSPARATPHRRPGTCSASIKPTRCSGHRTRAPGGGAGLPVQAAAAACQGLCDQLWDPPT